ncbi:MAG: HAD family hydrolase [Firmicutes bacterium]|nr:HAD family hydrolase [Bacillota bacterium]
MKRPALFLDRDGTLNEEVHYLHRPEDARLTAGAAQALAEANRRGIPVIVVSNQAGIGKGIFGWEQYGAVMERIDELLAQEGAHIDAAYACPFHEAGQGEYRYADHPDRKPNPGMLLRAAEEHDLDLSRSWMIGDKDLDLETGRRAGCRVALVRTGYGAEVDGSQADLVVPTLAAALSEILSTWPC